MSNRIISALTFIVLVGAGCQAAPVNQAPQPSSAVITNSATSVSITGVVGEITLYPQDGSPEISSFVIASGGKNITIDIDGVDNKERVTKNGVTVSTQDVVKGATVNVTGTYEGSGSPDTLAPSLIEIVTGSSR